MQLIRVLREPLLHFFVLGVLFFVLYSSVSDDGIQAPDEIVVDAERVAAIESQFERTWQRLPTPDELAGLIDSWIREEMLYREGMALGLDRNDPILRRRVAQKMEFITEGLIDSPPTEEELTSYFTSNLDDYRVDPRFSFRQFYFDPIAYGESLDAVIERSLEELADGKEPDSTTSLLPPQMINASQRDVQRTFGDAFAEGLNEVSVDQWTGPLASGYGLHLVFIDQKQEGRPSDFDEVRDSVEREVRAKQSRERKDANFETIRQRYTVTVDGGITRTNGSDRLEQNP